MNRKKLLFSVVGGGIALGMLICAWLVFVPNRVPEPPLNRKKLLFSVVGGGIALGMLICAWLVFAPNRVPEPPLVTASDLALQGRIAFVSYGTPPPAGIIVINADGTGQQHLSTILN